MRKVIYIAFILVTLNSSVYAVNLTPSLTAGVGYDDNIDFLASDVSKDGLFLIRPRIDFDANLSEEDIISGTYSWTYQKFLMGMNGNFTDNFGYAAYEHYFTDRLSIELAGEGEIFNDSVVSLYNYRRTAVLPSVKYLMGNTMAIFSYGLFDIDFPDRTIQTGGDKQKDTQKEVSMFMLHGMNKATNIGGGYSYKSNSSNNDFYDYTSQNITIGVWHQPFERAGLNLIYQYQFVNFHHWSVNSSLRNDSYNRVYVEFDYRINKLTKLLCQYNYLLNDSNDANLDFKKNYIFLGVKYFFESWRI